MECVCAFMLLLHFLARHHWCKTRSLCWTFLFTFIAAIKWKAHPALQLVTPPLVQDLELVTIVSAFGSYGA